MIVNTRDAMWQVDGLVQLASTLASLALTQTSLAEDLEIWASSEFDYVELAEEYTRASVLMPQKRNPYSLSMIRGTTGVLIGHVAGMLAVQKSPSARSDNLIFAYGEIPDALEHARRMTELTAGVVATLTMNEARLRDALANGFSQSTDVAEQLMVSCGVDYRTAYQIVGAAVRRLAAEGGTAGDLSPMLLDQIAVEQLGPAPRHRCRDAGGRPRPVGHRRHARCDRRRGAGTDACDARRGRRRRRLSWRPRRVNASTPRTAPSTRWWPTRGGWSRRRSE